MIGSKTLAAVLVTLLGACRAGAETPAPLALERTIALPNVSGRIDHLSVDLARKRLLVAELGNGTVDVIDLDGARAVGRIAGLKEPQGPSCPPIRRASSSIPTRSAPS